MPESRTCSECGTPLKDDAPEGFCPACMLQGALDLGASRLEFLPSSETRFGDYELLEEIARGGMGVVYRARQVSLDRIVAVKLILLGGYAGEASVRRFYAEAAAAAKLQHPNIVAIHEVGEQDGQPFFSMDYVEGQDLEKYAREHPFTAWQAAQLVQTLAEAVQYAHEHGIIHRDLKPSNILIDGAVEPHITDFGLARRLDNSQPLAGHSGAQRIPPAAATPQLSTPNPQLTLTGQVLGSPSYLPPEQASGKRGQVGPRTDIYALGAILYFLLTGRPPFAAETISDTLHEVLHEEPVAPRALNRSIPRDLETICLKCLEKEPARRYASAKAMAQDLGRFVRKEPVLARRITASRRLVRWAQRNPLAGFLSGLTVFLGLTLLVGTSWALWRISAERNQAMQRADEAIQQRRQAEENLRSQRVARIEMLFRTDQAVDAMALLGQLYAEHPADVRLAEWIANELTYRNFAVPLVGPLVHSDRVHLVRFSPNGRLLVTGTGQNAAQVWEVSSGKRLGQPLQHSQAAAKTGEFLGGLHPIYAEFSPDSRWVATGSVDGTAQVWDAETGHPRHAPLRHPDWVTFVRFSPDGKLLATACRDGVARLWETETGRPIGATFAHKDWINTVVFSPDGTRVATASDDMTARVWEVASGRPLTAEPLRHYGGVREARFSPDGKLLATASSDGSARIWDAETGAPRSARLLNQAQVVVVQFSPDGRLLATGGFDRTVRLWRVATGQPHCAPLQHRGTIRSIEFSSDGFRVVSASEDRTARVWEVRGGTPVTESLRHDDIVWSACFSPDGCSVATASSDRTVLVWDIRSGKARPVTVDLDVKATGVHWVDGDRCLMTTGARVRLHEAQSGHQLSRRDLGTNEQIVVAIPVAGRSQVFVATQTGRAAIWDAERVERLTSEIEHGAPLTCAAVSRDGGAVATASQDGRLRIWEALTAREIRSPLIHPAAVTRVEFSPDGRSIATASTDFTVRLWDLKTGKEMMPPLTHQSWIYDLAFSPDGRLLATASQDGTANVCDAIKGQACYLPLRHRGAVMDVDFNCDGSYLVTASRDGSARVWNTATGQPAGGALNLGPAILDATFSPTTRHLALACDDGKVGVWDSFTAQPLVTNLRHDRPVNACQFNSAGSRLATAASDHSSRIWDLVTASGTPPGWLADLVEMVVGGGTGTRPGSTSEESVQAVRARLLSLPAPEPWSSWLQWFLADRSARPVSPSTSESVGTLIEQHCEQAGDVGSRENFEKMLEAIWLRPFDGRLYSRAAVVLSSLLLAEEPDRLLLAERLSRRALELEPGSALSLWARASYLDLSGEAGKAATVLEQAAKLGSDDLYFWLWSAWFYDRQGRPEQAAVALSKAIELSQRIPRWNAGQPGLRQLQAKYPLQPGLGADHH